VEDEDQNNKMMINEIKIFDNDRVTLSKEAIA